MNEQNLKIKAQKGVSLILILLVVVIVLALIFVFTVKNKSKENNVIPETVNHTETVEQKEAKMNSAISTIKETNTEAKIYTGVGLTIILTSEDRVTIYGVDYDLMGENIELKEIQAPVGTENPEEYSRFVSLILNGGEVIAGFTKDNKAIYVDNVKFELQEKK